MIRRLRLKFSLLLTGSLLALFAVIVTSMNVINYHAVVREADQTLALLVGNEGRFPDPTADKGGRPPHDGGTRRCPADGPGYLRFCKRKRCP